MKTKQKRIFTPKEVALKDYLINKQNILVRTSKNNRIMIDFAWSVPSQQLRKEEALQLANALSEASLYLD